MTKVNIKLTYKSNNTEEWFDRIWTHPIDYWRTRLFERLDSALQMFLGYVSPLRYFSLGAELLYAVNV